MGKAKIQFNNSVWWLRKWSKMIYGCSVVTSQSDILPSQGFTRVVIKNKLTYGSSDWILSPLKLTPLSYCFFPLLWRSDFRCDVAHSPSLTGVIPSVHLSGLNLESHHFSFSHTCKNTHALLQMWYPADGDEGWRSGWCLTSLRWPWKGPEILPFIVSNDRPVA